MIRLRSFALLGLVAVAGPVLLDGCANKSVTSGGNSSAVPRPRTEGWNENLDESSRHHRLAECVVANIATEPFEKQPISS